MSRLVKKFVWPSAEKEGALSIRRILHLSVLHLLLLLCKLVPDGGVDVQAPGQGQFGAGDSAA